MSFILAQIIGVVVTVYAVAATQFKTVKATLWMEIITNLLTALNYILLGGLSGGWVCIVAAVQGIVMNYLNQHSLKNQEKIRNIVLVVFSAIYIVGSVMVFKTWIDIFPCLCALIYSVNVCQKEILRYKIVSIFNPLTWLFYDFVTRAYSTVLLRIILIVLTGVAIMRIIREGDSYEKRND